MPERLRSVGLDVGTTSTQMILSELTVENRASAFAVPEMEIARREILYRSPVYFTPLLDENRVDAARLREIISAEYAAAGIQRESVDTGAIIITGETSRKENAQAALEALSDFAGEFVVATAGPDLESVLAAKGAGAPELSEKTGKPVLHMDIGGGTSNLALIQEGKIVATGCLNVGGRLLKFDENQRISYVSPVLDGITPLEVGDSMNQQEVEKLARTLTAALETAAGKGEETALYHRLLTAETESIREKVPQDVIVSFSGGVADCIETVHDPMEFGDLGPLLGQAIRNSRLCGSRYALGAETIRATAIGAGCHSAQLSGSTVFYRNVRFPMKNLPVVRLSAEEQHYPETKLTELIHTRLGKQEQTSVLALPGLTAPGYGQVVSLAKAITTGFGTNPVLVALEQDMAKALGQAMALRLPGGTPCLCIDRVRLEDESYLDVGAPVGPALPIVVKTLILSH